MWLLMLQRCSVINKLIHTRYVVHIVFCFVKTLAKPVAPRVTNEIHVGRRFPGGMFSPVNFPGRVATVGAQPAEF